MGRTGSAPNPREAPASLLAALLANLAGNMRAALSGGDLALAQIVDEMIVRLLA